MMKHTWQKALAMAIFFVSFESLFWFLGDYFLTETKWMILDVDRIDRIMKINPYMYLASAVSLFVGAYCFFRFAKVILEEFKQVALTIIETLTFRIKVTVSHILRKQHELTRLMIREELSKNGINQKRN